MKVHIEGDGSSCLGVLQPVTSLVSTLSLLKPQHHSQLLKKLINPPRPTPPGKESAKTNSKPAIFMPVSLKSKGQLPTRRYRTASQVLQNISQPSPLEQKNRVPVVLPGEEKLGLGGGTKCGVREREASSMEDSESCSVGNGFMASCASDCELYAGLQLLFRESKSDKSMHTCTLVYTCTCYTVLVPFSKLTANKIKKSSLYFCLGMCDDSVQSCLLSALADAPPFTHLPLLPWFPYTQHCSINHQDIERLQE